MAYTPIDPAGAMMAAAQPMNTLQGGGGGYDMGRRNNALAAHGGPTNAAASSMSRDEFIESIAPYAIAEGKRLGIDPRIIIAQAAQETGWGRSAPNNNYFGIKSHGKPGGSTQNTHEFVNGQRVNVSDSFRGYGGMGDSVAGYGNFLESNPRYQPMLDATTFDGQINALGKSGYATDPNYASSVRSIAEGINLSPYRGQ